MNTDYVEIVRWPRAYEVTCRYCGQVEAECDSRFQAEDVAERHEREHEEDE